MLNYFNVLCSALVSGESEVKEGKGDLVGEGQGEESQGGRGRPDTEEGLEEGQPPEQLHCSSEPWANSDELKGRIDSCHIHLIFFMP